MAPHIEQAITVRLLAVTGVTDLVSTRVYANKLPQDPTLPALIYNQISGPRNYAMGGPTGLVESRFQLDMFDSTKSGVEGVADAVRLALSAYTGTVSVTGGSVQIDLCLLDNEIGGWEDEHEALMYRKTQDYLFHYRETAAS